MLVKSRMGIQPLEVLFIRRSFFLWQGNVLIVFENPSAKIMWFVVFLEIFKSELGTL